MTIHEKLNIIINNSSSSGGSTPNSVITELAQVISDTTERTIVLSTSLSSYKYFLLCQTHLSPSSINQTIWTVLESAIILSYEEFINGTTYTTDSYSSSGVLTNVKFTYINDTSVKIKVGNSNRAGFLLGIS